MKLCIVDSKGVNKLSFIKKCLACILVVVIAFNFVIPIYTLAANVWDSDFLAQENDSEEETEGAATFTKVAEKNGRVLFADKKSGCFYIKDISAGNCWYSNPQMISDSDASGIYQMEARSLFLVSVYDFEAEMISKANSEALGVRDGDVKFENITDGFRVIYNLKSIKIKLSLEIKLTSDGIEVNLPVKDIKETGNLLSVSVLPYFNAGTKEDEGYILLPDGSGSLLYFNNGHTTANEYNVPLYGSDISSANVMKTQDVYSAKLPVYGIKNGASSLLAVIQDGAGQGKIHALTNGKYTSFANCFSEFVLRGSDTVVLGETAGNPQSYQMYQKEDIDLKNITINFMLFSGETVDYNIMASSYREFLKKEYGIKEKNNSGNLYLEFYGAVKKKKNFLGIPITVNETLSKIEKIEGIIKTLNDNGITESNIVLKEWSKSQLTGKAENGISILGKVGSNKELKDFNSLLEKQNSNLFLLFDIQKAAKSSGGVSVFRDTVKNISNMPAGKYTFKENTLVKNNNIAREYFFKSSAQNKLLSKVTKGLSKNKLDNIALSSLDVYSDYGKKTTSKSTSVNNIKKILEESLSGKNLAVEFPADYTFSYVKKALNVPVSSNEYTITDQSIPFYQLATAGLIECVGPQINLSSDSNYTFLKCLETGSSLNYALITEENSVVTNTTLDWLYSADFAIWKDNIIERAKVMKTLDKLTDGSFMIAHKTISKDLYEITYKNGAKVYVNYADSPNIIDGIQIEAMGYKFRDKNGEWK